MLPIRANARVLGATLVPGQTLEYHLDPSHHGYLVPSAAVDIHGVAFEARDGAAICGETSIHVTAKADAELILVHTAR